MKDNYDSFYKSSSKKFKKYQFNSKAKHLKGEKPDFFKLIKKYSNKNFKVLDVGCGSGELTLKLSPFFKQIIGVDPYEDYIKTANESKKDFLNVEFIIADGKNIPFKDCEFDLIYSSRGPVSQNAIFLKETFRVLKKGGLLIEETIGEEDKLELKKLFGRGQNFPYKKTKLEEIKALISDSGLKLIFSKYYKYYQLFDSLEDLLYLLERAPIIPGFDKLKDKNKLSVLRSNNKINKIILSTHRLHWIGRKRL